MANPTKQRVDGVFKCVVRNFFKYLAKCSEKPAANRSEIACLRSAELLRSGLVVVSCLFFLSTSIRPSFAQSTRSTESASASTSAFSTPPSFERVPTRIPGRGASLNASETSRQSNVGSQSAADASPVTQRVSPHPSEDEWIPKPLSSQSSQYQSPQHQVSQYSNTNHAPQGFAPATSQNVQHANYTVSPSTEFAPVQTASATRNSSSASIPLKPPSAETVSLAPTKSRSTWTSAVSMICSLLLVIAIFLGLSWMFRKTSAISGAMLPKEVVEIIGRTPMANRQQLYVIRFGRKLVLVSQQIGQTEVLSEIDDRSEVDHLLGLCEQTNSKGVATSFRNVLQQVATTTESKWAIRQKRNAERAIPSNVTTSFDSHS